MPRSGKKVTAKRIARAGGNRSRQYKSPSEPSVIPLGVRENLREVDWTEEFDALLKELAPQLCDSPEKCKLLVLKVSLIDGSAYLVKGHGSRIIKLPDGTREVAAMYFVGQDMEQQHVALVVRPRDILKIELVDVPEEIRPPFGFATRISSVVHAPAALQEWKAPPAGRTKKKKKKVVPEADAEII